MNEALKMLSVADLEALQAGDLSKVSTKGLQMLTGEAPAEAPVVSAGKAINQTLGGIPRQIGLTARSGIEGLGQASEIFTEPLRFATDRIFGQVGKTEPTGKLASRFADFVGLPAPEGPTERVVADATRLMAGAGGLGGVARLASSAAGPVASQVASSLAANPANQLAAAAGSGLAGGASREAGGDGLLQGVASLVGGVAGGLAPGAVSASVRGVKGLLTPSNQVQTDIKIAGLLGPDEFAALPSHAKNTLRKELKSALDTGREVDPQAVRNLADFATVRGATPTRGMLSQDPVQITREMNLAKIGANSSDGQLQGLAKVQNQNNRAIINRLNEIGGGADASPIKAGQLISGKISETHTALSKAEQQAWDAAKSLPGYKQPIEPNGVNAAAQALADDALTGFLPKPISEFMGAFQTGEQPFTPQQYKNLQSMLSKAMAAGGNEAAAAATARRALESTPLIPVSARFNPASQAVDPAPNAAIDAVNAARAATRAKFAFEESTPLVRSALSGARSAAPETLAKSFVLNGTLDDAVSVANAVGPDGLKVIRDTIVTDIKRQALGKANDEFGKVSQSALNNAINRIGEDKLKLFFSPEDLAALKATGRVAALIQNQPVGSAVNNSNSGALVLGRGADVIGSLAGKIPFGSQAVSDPLRNLNISLSQSRALNTRPALLTRPQGSLLDSLAIPGTLAGAGLLAP